MPVSQLMHELLLSCSLDYSLAVLLPEAGLTDLGLPDRQAMCVACPRSMRPAMCPVNPRTRGPFRRAGSLGLDAAGEEPLLAQLVRMHLKGDGARVAPQPATAAAVVAMAGTLSASLPERERVGASSTLRGGMLGDLPALGERGAAAGGDGAAGGEQQDEEERRLNAIETKLAGLAGMGGACTPLAAAAVPSGGMPSGAVSSRLASGPPSSLAPVRLHPPQRERHAVAMHPRVRPVCLGRGLRPRLSPPTLPPRPPPRPLSRAHHALHPHTMPPPP